MNINQAHNEALMTFIDEMLSGKTDEMSKGDVAVHVLDLMAESLRVQELSDVIGPK